MMKYDKFKFNKKIYDFLVPQFFYRTPIYISWNTLVLQNVVWGNTGTNNAVPMPKHLATTT